MTKSMGFGWIKELCFVDGEPVFDPMPRCIHLVKPGCKNGPVQGLKIERELRNPGVIDMANALRAIGKEVVAEVVVRDGLPAQINAELIKGG